MNLREIEGVEVFARPALPTFVSGPERVIVFDGKHGFVSEENFAWMLLAPPEELGRMRVMRITSTASHGWLPKAPVLESFRYHPEEPR